MGRKRRADRDAIIDAVGVVIREQGLEALSIDAVARAAGIGKASVLYDFRNRDTLLAAFVQRRILLHRQALETLRDGHSSGSDATIRALLDYAGRPRHQDDLGNGMLVAAAASRNENFRTFLAECIAGEIRQVEMESAVPDRARLAYFALQGMFALECFGFCTLDEQVRRRMLDNIGELVVPASTPPEKPAGTAPDPSGPPCQEQVTI